MPTTWRDHPYDTTLKAFLLAPVAIYQAQVDTTTQVSGTNTYNSITPKNETLGSIVYVKPGMTMSLGSSAGGWDKGYCRVHGDGVLSFYAPPGTRAGEVTPDTDTYLTVWGDYRIWYKPPFYSDTGNIYKDGYGAGGGAQGAPYNLVSEANRVGHPVPNGGAGYAGAVDADADVISLNFDGGDSFVVDTSGIITAYGDDETSGGTASASTTNGGNVASNAFDAGSLSGYAWEFTYSGDATTAYWEATTSTGWLEYQFASAKTIKSVWVFAQGASSPKDFTIEYHNGSSWVAVKTVTGASFGSGSAQRRAYYILTDNSATRWRINVSANNGGSNLRIYEVFMRAAASGYEWDFDDGSPVSSSAEAPTGVTFPPGFRWVNLTVTDSYELRNTCHIPTFAYGNTFSEPSYAGLTKDASTASSAASNAFDSSTSTSWVTTLGNTTGWLRIQFASAQNIGRYGVQAPSFASQLARMANTWTFEGSDNGTDWTVLDTQSGETAWSVSEERTFTLADIVSFTYYRINITANDGDSSFLTIAELNLYAPATTVEALETIEIVQHDITADGQVMRLRVYDDLDLDTYPPGTLVMVWEEESFAGVEGSLAGPSGREHMRFIGWLDEEFTTIEATEHGTLSYVEFQCLDVAGRLKQLPAKPEIVYRDADGSSFIYVRGLNKDRFMYWLLHWHTTALNLADFQWSGTGDLYANPEMTAKEGTMWDQVQDQAATFRHRLTCDSFGRLWVKADPQLAPVDAVTGDGEAYADTNRDTWVDLNHKTIASYGSDQATSGNYIESGHYLTNSGDRAFDDNTGINWTASTLGSGVGSDYIGQDFTVGVTKAIRRIRFWQTSASYNAVTSVKSQYSDNGSAWSDAATHSVTAAGAYEDLDIPDVGAHRYWRLLSNSGTGGGRWVVYEIEMLEVATWDNGDSKLCQTFQVSDTSPIWGVTLTLDKEGSPTGTGTVRLETVSGGNPTGTLVDANATGTFSEASDVSASGGDVIVLFSDSWTPTASTTYAIVISDDITPDESNYLRWGADASSPAYASGEMKSYDGSSWNAESKDAIFTLQVEVLAGRTSTVIDTLTEDDITALPIRRTYFPRYHWLRSNGVIAVALDYDDGSWSPSAVFNVAPGNAPGQGAQKQQKGEQLVVSQTEYNETQGHLYALLNALYAQFDLPLAHGGAVGYIEPAYMQWVQLTAGVYASLERLDGFTSGSDTFRALPVALRVRYDPEAGTKEVTLTLEKESIGQDAVTET